jgi:hypothetical protein
MELTAFTSNLGATQGRVETTDAPSGRFAFALGDLEPGRVFELAAGDHADVTQDTDLTGVDFVRATLRLRVPKSLPLSLAWEASILVDGVAKASFRVRAGRERVMRDLAANVSKLAGLHSVGVRLALVSA